MRLIEFTVPAIPVAQPRPRATSIAGRARMYTPTDHPIAAFKASVRLAAASAFSGPPMAGPLRVDCTFVLPRTNAQRWKTRPMPRLPHTKKPDRDNLDKAVLDALTGLLWADDCQICSGEVTKWIAAGDEQPHVLVRVSEVQA
jgi:Holliday junction resolvase RusA-like endonuclease